MDNEVLKLLKTKGYKHTPQRRAIIEILLEVKSPLSVKEIVEKLLPSFPEISTDTVYRNLKMLCDLEIVSEIKHQGKKGARYELDGKPHHHHLVCISCGKSLCMPNCNIEEQCATIATRAGFKMIGHTFEIHGYCNDCQQSNIKAERKNK